MIGNERQLGFGVETEKRIVELFTEVRDMPFEVVRYDQKMNYERIIEETRKRKRGACSAKHYLLGSEYEQMGIKTFYVSYPFFWQDLDVDYPQNIRTLVERMPKQYHLSLGVVLNCELFLIDASWDPALKKARFPVNDLTDGVRSTRLTVVPCGEPAFHLTGSERWAYIESIKQKMKFTGIEPEFYTKLNNWLEKIRAG